MREDIQQAIDTHGARAVHDTAMAHMQRAGDLRDLGIAVTSLGDINEALAAAYDRLSPQDAAETEARNAIDLARL